MPQEATIDAKPETAPSATPAATASHDDKATESRESSSPDNQQAAQTEETLADVTSKAFEASLAKEAAEKKEPDKEILDSEEEESSDEAEAPVEKDEEPTEAEEKEAETASKPSDEVPQEFHEHPAWKRIIGERNEAREKATGLEREAQSYREHVEYCRSRGISDEQYREALEIVSLVNSDPAKAYDKLRPLVEALETHTGRRLPDDLSKKVEEGTLDPETATEVARLRAEREFATRKQASDSERAQREMVAAMSRSLTDWETNKRQNDPDFERKTDLVRGVYLSLMNATDSQGRPTNPIRSPQDAVALAEKAYAEVNEKIAGFVPKAAPRKVLTSSGASSSKTKVEPKSVKDAVNAMLHAKHGVGLD